MTFTCFFAYLLLKVIKGVNFIDFSSAIFWAWNVLLTQIYYATGTRRLFIYLFYIFWYQKYAALGSYVLTITSLFFLFFVFSKFFFCLDTFLILFAFLFFPLVNQSTENIPCCQPGRRGVIMDLQVSFYYYI